MSGVGAESIGSTRTVWTWGGLEFGVYASNTFDAAESTRPTKDFHGAVAASGGLAFNLALKSDGTVWGWGDDSAGQIGDNSTSNKPLPVQSQGLAGMTAVAAGFRHGLALGSDGRVWSWGDNTLGQVGDGRKNPDPIPAPVGGLSGVVKIAAGAGYSLALRGDGTVWSWGDNAYGQLGRVTPGTIDAVPAPVTGVTGAVAVAAGYRHALALRADGTVMAWGNNDAGELGSATLVPAMAPLAVPGLAGVTAVSAGLDFSVALLSDGTVWAWGSNGFGQLGLAPGGESSVPARIMPLNGIRAISSSMNYTLATNAAGAIWMWGADNTVIRTMTPPGIAEPVRVGCFTGPAAVTAGPSQSLAVADDSPQLVATPSEVQFDAQTTGDLASERTVTLKNPGTSPTFLVSWRFEGDAGNDVSVIDSSCPETLCPGESCRLKLQYRPGTPGVHRAVLRAKDFDGVEHAEVPIMATVVAPGKRFDTDGVEFGGVGVGDRSSLRRVTVMNSGPGILIVQTAQIVGDAAAEFSVEPGSTPARVPAGGRLTLGVRFSPAGMGARTASLQLLDNAGNLPLVALQGTGEIQIVPGKPGLMAGETTTMAVTPAVPVTWSLLGPGTLDADGTYHAPAALGADDVAMITARSADGTLTHTLAYPLWTPLTAGPAGVSLNAGESLALTTTSRGDVTWVVAGGDSAGTVTLDGVYHAPARLQADLPVHLTATAADGSNRTAALDLMVRAPRYGDLNGDGRVTVQDAILMMQALVGAQTLTPQQALLADVGGTGKLDIRAAVAILRKAVGL